MTPNPCFRERMPVWAELDQLLGEPEFDCTLSGVNTTYRRLQAFGRVLGPARKLYRDPDRLLAGMEWAGVVDPSMMHAAMVHFGVVTTAIVECGRSNHDLDPLVAGLDTVSAVGAIVATELGRGGSQVNIRTEARFDRERRTFVVHTPGDHALKIMPNIAWTGLPRTAVVNARLIVDNTDHGVHAFAFRFPHPQAQVSALPGNAPVPLDYAVIRFNHAEIPYGYWLSDDVTISDSGVTDPLSPHQRLARSLGGVNTAVASAAVALASACRATVAIAARYNVQRLIGHPGKPALEFSTHSVELASAIARTYANSLYADTIRREFVEERLSAGTTSTPRVSNTAEHAPWLSANLDRTLAKAAATTTLEAVAATSRRLCGFQGVLHANRITVYEDMSRSFHSAGGDTRLLLLEAGKKLIQDTGAPAVRVTSDAALGDPQSVFRLITLQERALADQLRGRGDRENPNDDLHDIEYLARVHIVRRTLEEFAGAVRASEGRWRTVLGTVQRLYGIDALLDSAAWHLNHSFLVPGDLEVLRHARAASAQNVIEHLNILVDGLSVPPGRAGGMIGRADYIDRVSTLNR